MIFSTAFRSSRSLGNIKNLTLDGSARVDVHEMKDTAYYFKTSKAHPATDGGGEVVTALSKEIQSSKLSMSCPPGRPERPPNTCSTLNSGAKKTQCRRVSADSVKYQVWCV